MSTPAGRVDKVSHPTSVFLFADGLPGEATGIYAVHGNAGGSTLGDTLTNGSYLFDRTRHRYWMNVVFVDGHAETLMMWDRNRPAGRDYGNVGEFDRAWVSNGLILQ